MFLTVKELSELLKIKTSTIYSWVTKGKIPFRKINGLIRFWSGDISEWLDSFPSGHLNPIALNSGCNGRGKLDDLIARAKREAYNPRHGETRMLASLTRKEGKHGAL